MAAQDHVHVHVCAHVRVLVVNAASGYMSSADTVELYSIGLEFLRFV